MEKLHKFFICFLAAHDWELVHEEGNWLMGDAHLTWKCKKCKVVRHARPWNV